MSFCKPVIAVIKGFALGDGCCSQYLQDVNDNAYFKGDEELASYSITEIGEGLFQISSRLGPRYVHQYLLKEKNEALLLDVGMMDTPEKVIIPACKDIGINLDQIKMIVISHADVDHFSGLKNMRENAKNAITIAHSFDVPWIESCEKIQKERYFYYESLGVFHDDETKRWFIDNLHSAKIDLHFNGGETICLGDDRYIDVIHTPGHSEGHLSLYDRKNKAAMVVDAILWKGLYDTEGTIISPPPYYFVDEYIHSILTILQLDINVLLTGHFDPLKGIDAQVFLHESKQFVKNVEETIYSVIEDKPQSLREILLKTNDQVGKFTAMMVELVGPVYAHLLKLEKVGSIHRTMIENKPFWYK